MCKQKADYYRGKFVGRVFFRTFAKEGNLRSLLGVSTGFPSAFGTIHFSAHIVNYI